MADYSDFLDAPDDGEFDAFLNAPEQPKRPQKVTRQPPTLMQRARTAADPYIPQEAVDFMGGATSTMRGGLNLVGKAFNGSKWGDIVFPTDRVNKDSWSYIGGQVADPAAYALGMGAGKVVQALPAATTAFKTAQAAGPTAKLTAETVLRGGVTGGLTGGATAFLGSEGDLDGTGVGTGYGTLFGAAAPVIGKGVQQGVGWTADKVAGRSAKVKAGEIARATAGGNLDAIRTAMRGAPTDLTAGQAAYGIDQDMWQALQKLAKDNDPSTYYRLLAERQAAQRSGRIAAVTPDVKAAVATKDARTAAEMAGVKSASQTVRAGHEASFGPAAPRTITQPSNLQPGMMTQQRVAGAPVNPPAIPQLEGLRQNRIVRAAAAEASNMARNRQNLPPQFSRLTQAELDDIAADPMKSLEGLKFMKAVIDERFGKNPPANSLQEFGGEALTNVKNALMAAGEKLAPGWQQARTNTQRSWAPVNQANVLNELTSVLDKPTGGERVTPFLNALGRGEESALRRAGIDTRFADIGDVLTPQQMEAVNQAKGELVRDAALTAQAKAGDKALIDVLGQFSSHFKAPNTLTRETTIFNQFMDFLNKNTNEKTKQALIEGMKSGKSAAEMLDTLPTAEKNKLRTFFAWSKAASPQVGRLPGQSQEKKE